MAQGEQQPKRGRSPGAERDAELVARIQRGDADAWPELLERRQDQIFATCYRMIGDRETARDLAQDAIVRLIERIGDFDGRAAFATWMTRVTMNVCISYLRRMKLRRHASLETPVGGDEAGGRTLGGTITQSTEPAAGGGVEDREDLKRLSEAMHRLDPEQTAILMLRDVQGLDYATIADVLQTPVGTVKSRLFRARAALRERIEQGGTPASGEGD